MAFENCLADIRKASGLADLSDEEAADILDAVHSIARRIQRERKLTSPEALQEAAAEAAQQAATAAQIEKRNALLNLVKRQARRAYYEGAPDFVTGVEAKLVGVNTPFHGARLSVDAGQKALAADYIAGLASELDRAGLFKAARSGAIEREWARELFELSKGAEGKPGVTGSKEALAIARIVAKYQALAKDNLNRAGAAIGDYSGYIARTDHEPDKIRRAGFDAWKETIAPLLDERTFDGVEDRECFLRSAWHALIAGVHLQEDAENWREPAFTGPGSVAKRASASRKLHFKDAESWLDYHGRFGSGSVMETVLHSLHRAARATALLREFGTNPRLEFENDLRYLAERYRDEKPDAVIALRGAENKLTKQFDELDGTATMPANRLGAQIGAGWRALQAMAKLGNVAVSSFGDVPLKAAELKYNGIGLLQAYGDGLASLIRGRGRTEGQRAVIDDLRAAHEGLAGSLASRWDGIDTVPGKLSRLQNVFYRVNGLQFWTDAQRAGASMMLARNLARQIDQSWQALKPETQNALKLYGIDSERWDLIRRAELTQAEGRSYVTPSVVQSIPDEALSAYIANHQATLGDRLMTPEALRRDLAMRLHSYFQDRTDYAILTPGARERALLHFGGRSGTLEGELARLLTQFRAFSAAYIYRVIGRETFGRRDIGGKTAGLFHIVAGTTLFGYGILATKALLNGQQPPDPTKPATWAAALSAGGGLGVLGDFLLGHLGAASLFGPTAGLIDEASQIIKSAEAGHDVKASIFKALLDQVPFGNVVGLRSALNYLLLYRIQEALNPGFLRRMERKAQQRGQPFFLAPSAVVQ